VSKTKKFDIKDNDYFAFDIAKHTARRLLKHPNIKPMQVICLGKALYSLERLPLATEGICCEFGLVYRSGTEEFNEIKYINFKISEDDFEIFRSGSVYDKSLGSDSYSNPSWYIEIDGYRETECELFNIESAIEEYINLGAEIIVSDESLLIYDSQGDKDVTISRNEKYFNPTFERCLNFKKFCNSITELEFMEVIDAITNEISTTDQIEDSAKKKDSYLEDLMVLLRLFTSTTFPKNEVRANFISDAYSLLRKLESTLMSVKSMNLVKIADVYYTQTDETYYVFKKYYDEAYEYIADNKEQTKKLLSDDEWHCIGKIGRWDNVLVEAYSKGNKIIAIWDDIT
jgi:hypothetical protein